MKSIYILIENPEVDLMEISMTLSLNPGEGIEKLVGAAGTRASCEPVDPKIS